jgi:hypothetical protein
MPLFSPLGMELLCTVDGAFCVNAVRFFLALVRGAVLLGDMGFSTGGFHGELLVVLWR